jgi:PAS domain S-box-containing protein
VLLDPVRPYRLKRPQQRFVMGAGITVFLLGGLVVSLLIAVQRRDFARDRLAETEEHLARTLDGLDDAVITTNRHGVITRMNPSAVRLSGLSAEQALGRPLNEVFGRESLGSSQSPRRSTPSALLGESTLVTQNGRSFRVIERVAPLVSRDDSPMGFVHVFHDTTEERQLREQLQQAQKMEAVGRLAGGVAHDFNNLLMAITGNAELVNIRLGEHRVTPFVKEIIQAATHASELTRQLLAFSRKTAIRSVPVDAHVVIIEALSLLRRGLDPKICVEVELAATHSIIVGDGTQLQSTLLNLLINARDAMPDGGKLHVSTCNRSRVPSLGRAVKAKRGLEITIEDDGVGIPDSVRSRIFEPFFTTKAEGRGTGLGLAAVYSCVQSHKGHISVDSAEGYGSTFRIWFPSSDIQLFPETPPRFRPSTLGGHLIVADDDASVRTFAEDALRLLGYEVTTCDSGACAIRCCEQLGSTLSACILDWRMQGPTGLHLVQRLRAIVPDLPVLFVSGNSEEMEDELSRIPKTAFLAKPYRLTELGDALDRLLDAKRADKRSTSANGSNSTASGHFLV